MIGFFGGRQWQGALRSEQAEVPDENLQRRFFVVLLRPRNIGGGKFHEGVLPETGELLAQRRAVPDPWPVLKGSLELSQQRE